MKSAEVMLNELIRYVRPPRGCAIVLTEEKPKRSNEPNWDARSGTMETQSILRFKKRVAELRKTDTLIDWSDVKILDGQQRRVALWLSEVGDGNRAIVFDASSLASG